MTPATVHESPTTADDAERWYAHDVVALPSEKTTTQQFGVALLCAAVVIARSRFEGPAEGPLVAGNGVAG